MANLSTYVQVYAPTKVFARLVVLAAATTDMPTSIVLTNYAQAVAVLTENATRPAKCAYATMGTQVKTVRLRHALKNALNMELATKRLESARAP